MIRLTTLFLLLRFVAHSQSDFDRAFGKWLKDTKYDTAQLSIAVRDINADSMLFAFNEFNVLTPASIHKLYSTGFALGRLSPMERFETRLLYTGAIQDSTLKGNVIVLGGGDMTLGSRYFGDRNIYGTWAESVQKLGIKSIEGGVIADASHFSYDIIPSTWSEKDIGNYYATGNSGLSVYDNLFEIYFSTGKVGTEASLDSIKPVMPYVKVFGTVKAAKSSRDNCYIYGGPYVFQRKLTGSIPANRAAFMVKGSIPDPAYHVAMEFQKELAKSGIKLFKPATTRRILEMNNAFPEGESTFITEFEGVPLDSIIYHTNQKSINLFAEQLMLHTALESTNVRGYPEACARMKSHLRRNGVDTVGLRIFDGSGLSKENKTNAAQMNQWLSSMTRSPHFKVFERSLPVAGRSGSLKSMLVDTEVEGKLKAKSGSMKEVRAYAGYLTTERGTSLAFAFIINSKRPGSEMKRDLARLMEELSTY